MSRREASATATMRPREADRSSSEACRRPTSSMFSTTTTTKDASGNPQTTQLPLALLTLAVDQKTFQKIVTAQAAGGTLYFGLLNKDSKIDANLPGTNLTNLFK